MDLDGLLELAEHAAMEGGRVLLDLWGRRGGLNYNGPKYSTTADVASQERIIAILEKGSGGIPCLSEELDKAPPESSETYWVIDPLDGTWNYEHKGTWWSVSIALVHKGEIVLGLVHSPPMSRTYKAHKRMGGAVCNGARIGPDRGSFPGEWLVSFGAPSREKEVMGPLEANLFSDIRTDDPIRPIRVSRFLPGRGSTALELCSLADGRLNGLVRSGQKCWDIAGGLAIADKAGCAVICIDGRSWKEDVKNFSRDYEGALIGASDLGNLGILRGLISGSVRKWPQ